MPRGKWLISKLAAQGGVAPGCQGIGIGNQRPRHRDRRIQGGIEAKAGGGWSLVVQLHQEAGLGMAALHQFSCRQLQEGLQARQAMLQQLGAGLPLWPLQRQPVAATGLQLHLQQAVGVSGHG